MKPFLVLSPARVLGGSSGDGIRIPPDGPAGCKTRINLSPRVYAAHEEQLRGENPPKTGSPESSESTSMKPGC